MRSFIFRSALALVTALSLGLTVTSGVEAKGCPNFYVPKTEFVWAEWRPEIQKVRFTLYPIDRDRPTSTKPLRVDVNGKFYTYIPGGDLQTDVAPGTGHAKFYYLNLNACDAPAPETASPNDWKKIYEYWF